MADKKSSIIAISLSLIEKHEKEYMVLLNTSELRNRILLFKLELQSLETFHNISNNEVLKRSICEVSENVMQELQSLSGRPINEGPINVFENAYGKLKHKKDSYVWDPRTSDTEIIFQNTFFKTNFDFVLKSLEELSKCKANQNAPSIKEKLLRLHDLLSYIGDTVVDITIENQELLDPLLCSIDKAACILYSCLVRQKEEPTELQMTHYVKNIFMAFLIRSKLQGCMKESFSDESNLLDIVMEILNCTSCSRINLKDVCEKLLDNLRFLKMFLADLPHVVIIENLIHFTPFIENMTDAALHILHLCHDKQMKEDLFNEVNGVLADVIDQIEDVQAEVGEMKVYNAPKTDVHEIKFYNCPKTDALGFLDIFLGHVEEMLKCQPESMKVLKNETETLMDEFYSVRCLFKQIKKHEGFEDIRTNIIHLAYQAEHVIDSYLVKHYSNRRIKFTLSIIVEKIKLIQSEITKISGEKYVTRADNTNDKTFNNVPSQANPITIDDVVGFVDEAKKIMEFLVGDKKKLDIVSVVGLPGLGKTTLARKLFQDPFFIEHFDVRAWCTVSQTYSKRNVLLTILGDITNNTEDIKKLNDEELVAKIFQSLKGRRYLIVIDDLWDIEDWKDLARPFPDDKNRSRIIVTSRLHNVASQTKVDSKVHLLREFTDSESWELFEMKLFQNKLFHKGNFSKDFQEVGKIIVESCKGLPLAIVVIASLLLKEEKNVDKWKEIAVSLRTHILRKSESQCMAIFELSYNNLPDQLKSCFLYFGAFAEDEEIPLSKLKQLWIAEGFVRETGPKNLEELAEEYCMDLISRSLVTPTTEKSGGGIKSCRVHDLVHEFCLKKAEEENFLQVICTDNELKFSSIYDHRRLRINSDLGQFFNATPFGWSSVRSLFTSYSTREEYSRIMLLLCMNFTLLRVLDLGKVHSEWYFSGIETLIHLRYLHIKATLTSIPTLISNLWNLQFLRLECRDWRTSVSVPDSLWDMVHLRNVHITHSASFEVHPRRLNKSVLLDNLDTLAVPYLCYGEDAENLLRRLPNLRKLSCIFYFEDDTKECPRYPALDFLDQLMSLKVAFRHQRLLQQKHIELNFPSNLKKVTLSGFKGYWDDISRMGRILPNLEVLKLDYAEKEDDDIWVLEDGDFPKLKYLKLYGCFCEKWITSEDSFPILEKLVINSCYRLIEIPPHFGELPTLEMISVHDCGPSLCDSVREVQKNQEEWGNSALRIYITHPKKTDYDNEDVTKSNTEEHEEDEENIESNTEEYVDLTSKRCCAIQ